MSEIKREKTVVLRESLFAITGSQTEAIMLNQFLYWSQRMDDFDKYISEENERASKFSPETDLKELSEGWIYKKATELKDEIMSEDSEKTINRYILNLVEKGFLDRRRNPRLTWDRTYQYRVNLRNVAVALYDKGYFLQGYRYDISSLISDKKASEALKMDKRQNDASILTEEDDGFSFSKRQNDACIPPREDTCKRQNDASIRQNDASKRQIDGAIPEITSEITTEIILRENIEGDDPASPGAPSTPADGVLNNEDNKSDQEQPEESAEEKRADKPADFSTVPTEAIRLAQMLANTVRLNHPYKPDADCPSPEPGPDNNLLLTWARELYKLNYIGHIKAKRGEGKGIPWPVIEEAITYLRTGRPHWKNSVTSGFDLRTQITAILGDMREDKENASRRSSRQNKPRTGADKQYTQAAAAAEPFDDEGIYCRFPDETVADAYERIYNTPGVKESKIAQFRRLVEQGLA